MKNASRAALFIAILASPTIRATDLPADLAKAVEDYDQAQITGNRAELERLLADDYTLINGGGKTGSVVRGTYLLAKAGYTATGAR